MSRAPLAFELADSSRSRLFEELETSRNCGRHKTPHAHRSSEKTTQKDAEWSRPPRTMEKPAVPADSRNSTESGESQYESQPIDSLENDALLTFKRARLANENPIMISPDADEVLHPPDSRGDVHTVPETQGPDNNSPESVSISTPGEADTSPSTGAPELPTEIAPENVPKLKDLNKNSPVEQKLAYYRKTVKEMMAAGQAKSDMVAYKNLRSNLTPTETIGHIEGVKPGLRVYGKGELAILGVHCNICGGIYQKNKGPAFAIALAGGYADDDDTGAEFWYTGQGGQQKGCQVADQSFSASGNAALKQSCEQKQPVRVVRRIMTSKGGMPIYVYEGLYNIVEAKMAQGTHGFQICRFRMVAIPGESVVSAKVEHGKAPANFRKTKLASAPIITKKRKIAPSKTIPKSTAKRKVLKAYRDLQPDVEDISRTPSEALNVAQTLLDLGDVALERERPTALIKLVDDFTRGRESQPIPVYGNSESDLLLLPTGFVYTRESTIASEAAAEIVKWSKTAFQWKEDKCGIEVMGKPFILSDGRLTETLVRGLFECGPNCKTPECRFNRVISEGFKLPLEIFRTERRGWGMRCSQPIQIGTFICEYAGEVCSDTEAETRPHEYLFDLDHFALAEEGAPIVAVLPPDAEERVANGRDALLTIDGHNSGNMGRFLNHSCEGNVLLQPTFAPGACPHLYRVALFAARDIPAFEELCYHYGWSPRPGTDAQFIAEGIAHREVWCECGSENCQGRLL